MIDRDSYELFRVNTHMSIPFVYERNLWNNGEDIDRKRSVMIFSCSSARFYCIRLIYRSSTVIDLSMGKFPY